MMMRGEKTQITVLNLANNMRVSSEQVILRKQSWPIYYLLKIKLLVNACINLTSFSYDFVVNLCLEWELEGTI